MWAMTLLQWQLLSISGTYPSGHRADRLTAQIKRPKSHGLLNQFQNAGREAKGKKGTGEHTGEGPSRLEVPHSLGPPAADRVRTSARTEV